MPSAEVSTDITIVGAGPVGLYGAYCAGFRGLRTVVVDALPEVGGQIIALYPEKQVRDVAGVPGVSGRGLVAALREQADTYQPTYLLGRQATELSAGANGTLRLLLSDGTGLTTGAVVLTAGIGTFTPRPLPAGEAFLGRGLSYFVPDLNAHADRDVVVVGGGDSAIDWALALAEVARSVTLVHRRANFRAHAANVTAAKAAGVRFKLNAQVSELSGGGCVEKVRIAYTNGTDEVLAATSVVAALGFISDLGPLAKWGLELRGRAVVTNQRAETTLARVYAAGDLSDYDGKVRLMSVGFGEVATAVNNAAVALDPQLSLFPGHSTDSN